jgi:hypothetical protein
MAYTSVQARVLKDTPFPINEEVTLLFSDCKKIRKGIIIYDAAATSFIFRQAVGAKIFTIQLFPNYSDVRIWTRDGQEWSRYF